ncbi:hypothetical protein [Sphingosinicella terrae]|jgi:hypothetical protein|uniref:hypothetical protein n=1 Tax=Sphingosinicella terrae TaxID=2172047 RepID=UPI000E0D4950|nr:hypothetical protein [Sphingosinicella terrae]
MRWDHDGMLVVRADLADRLERLQSSAQGLTVRDFAQRLGTIRILASAYGLVPVVALADAFERAILSQPRGCPAGLYFERLRDAIGCERLDDAAGEALLASVSVRLAG